MNPPRNPIFGRGVEPDRPTKQAIDRISGRVLATDLEVVFESFFCWRINHQCQIPNVNKTAGMMQIILNGSRF